MFFLNRRVRNQPKTTRLVKTLVVNPQRMNAGGSTAGAYQQHLRSFWTDEEAKQHQQIIQKSNRNLLIAAASAVSAVVGFVLPAANLLSIVGIFYINSFLSIFFQQTTYKVFSLFIFYHIEIYFLMDNLLQISWSIYFKWQFSCQHFVS